MWSAGTTFKIHLFWRESVHSSTWAKIVQEVRTPNRCASSAQTSQAAAGVRLRPFRAGELLVFWKLFLRAQAWRRTFPPFTSVDRLQRQVLECTLGNPLCNQRWAEALFPICFCVQAVPETWWKRGHRSASLANRTSSEWRRVFDDTKFSCTKGQARQRVAKGRKKADHVCAAARGKTQSGPNEISVGMSGRAETDARMAWWF